MSRVSHIFEFSPAEDVVDLYGLPTAYCFCLTPSEACELLGQAAGSRPDLRDPILKKVCTDIDNAYSSCHRRLLSDLLAQLREADSRVRQGLGYCLSRIANHVPATARRNIQKAFLESKFVTLRRRGYKAVLQDIDKSIELVAAAWERFEDPECAWLIIKTFPASFVAANRESLSSAISEGWQVARLYIRLAEVDPHAVNELRTKDEITYCYVLAKLNRTLSEEDAIEIVGRSMEDDRFGLLVWSLGRLGLWGALRHVEAQLQEIQERRQAKFYRKWRPDLSVVEKQDA